MNTKDKQKKVNFLHSISAKILLLVAVVVILAVVGAMTNAIPQEKKALDNTNKNYIMSIDRKSVV